MKYKNGRDKKKTKKDWNQQDYVQFIKTVIPNFCAPESFNMLGVGD